MCCNISRDGIIWRPCLLLCMMTIKPLWCQSILHANYKIELVLLSVRLNLCQGFLDIDPELNCPINQQVIYLYQRPLKGKRFCFCHHDVLKGPQCHHDVTSWHHTWSLITQSRPSSSYRTVTMSYQIIFPSDENLMTLAMSIFHLIINGLTHFHMTEQINI